MDNFVKNTLQRWNLAAYTQCFEENEIDEEAFRCLTHESIKGLIPKVGPQTKFLKYWTSEFSVTTVTNLGLGLETNDANHLSSDFHRLHDALLSSLDAKFDLPSTSFASDLDTSEPNLGTAGTPAVLHTPSSISSNFSRASSTSNTISTVKSFPSSSPSTSSASLTSGSNNTYIKNILRLTPEGIAVLHHYERLGNLDNQRRILLAGVVIAAELKNSKDFKLSSDRLVELALLIQQQFPNESIDTYYIPYKLNKATNRKILAKGKLYDKYCSYRDLLRRNGAISAVKRKNGGQLIEPSRPVVLAFREQLNPSETEQIEDCLEKVQWLKNNLEPWPTVEQYWKDTSRHRIQQLSNTTELSSIEYLNTYSALKQPLGHTLINIDFSILYPEKTLELYGKWSPFQAEVIQYCRERKKSDPVVQKLLSHVKDDINPDTLVPVVLRLLPLLLPCTSIKVPNKPSWRPSKLKVQNGFFLHVPSIGHLDTALEKRKRKLLNHGLTEQPIPVIVGEELTTASASCYVYFNGIKYEVESPLKALDVTFKSFYALQLEYPKEAASTWMVIQKRLSNLIGEGDRVLPSVNTLLSDLGNYSTSAVECNE